MKQDLLLFIFLWAGIASTQAQSVALYTYSTETRPCAYDSTVSLQQFTSWDVYKTTNDVWDGPIDSSFCLGAANLWDLDLSGLGPNETVFMRYRFTDANKILLPSNGLFSVVTDFSSNTPSLRVDNNCADNLCSGLLIGVEIPDSAGTGKAIRWSEVPFSVSSPTSSHYELGFCLATEYFSENYLREAIYKFTTNTTGGTLMGTSYLYFSDANEYAFVGGDSLQYIKDSFDIPFAPSYNEYRLELHKNVLAIRSDTSIYPNSYGIEYVDLNPVPNVDTVATMNIEFGGSSTLALQPFVEFRGGYVLNDSTKRHQYNLINNGGHICFSIVVDMRLKSGNKYIHNSGSVTFSGKSSCMAFEAGSKLIVGEKATFPYGENGVGNLALYPNSTIDIKKGGHFILNNNLILFGSDNEQIYLTLEEGSRLTFSKFAAIKRHQSVYYPLQLNIYMKGGTVDMSELKAEYRPLVNLIYDEVQPTFRENVKILGNPVMTDVLRFSITQETEGEAFVQLLSIDGKVIFNRTSLLQKGLNYLEIPVNTTATGLYFLDIKTNEGSVTEKISVFRE
jgi:hypothetical protein